MNLHPLVVHFPIALLTVYALFELVRLKTIRSWSHWFDVKGTLLILGSLGSGVAYLTGEAIKPQFVNDPTFGHIVTVHSQWAKATVIIFGILALVYVVGWMRRLNVNIKDRTLARIWSAIERASVFVRETPIVMLLALAGLACVTVTGALGGAIVYGTDIDPFVSFIAKLLL